jgi:hypothetical protein
MGVYKCACHRNIKHVTIGHILRTMADGNMPAKGNHNLNKANKHNTLLIARNLSLTGAVMGVPSTLVFDTLVRT